VSKERLYIGVGPTAPVASSQTTTAAVAQPSPFVTENVMNIAVSYSGEKRKRVIKITRLLQNDVTTNECPNPVFLDKDFQHEISRLNGLIHLQSIYRRAQLVVVFCRRRIRIRCTAGANGDQLLSAFFLKEGIIEILNFFW
jgi:hypothetical protein